MLMKEIPTKEMVESGDSMYYDDCDVSSGLCLICMEPVDLEYGIFIEISILKKSGISIVTPGPRWFFHNFCYSNVELTKVLDLT